MEGALPKFELPAVGDGAAFGWGPPSDKDALELCLGDMAVYPFDPVQKQDRLGRVIDFSLFTQQKHQRDGKATQEAEAEFQVVDSRPVKVNRFQNRFVHRQQQIRRDAAQRQQNQQQQNQQQQQQNQQQQHQGMRGPGGQVQTVRQYQQMQQQRQQQWQRTNRQRLLAEWSIEPQHDWQLMDIRQLAQLPSLSLDVSAMKFEDLDWRGELRSFKKSCDKISPKAPQTLSEQFTTDRCFYWPGSLDDAVIVNAFDSDPSISVAATDQMLACLMASAQSRLSWHLMLHKANGRIFIDKQNGSNVDMLTVDETHKEPPLSDHPVRINRPVELAAEALKINQNFTQQVLEQQAPPVKRCKAAPFVEAGDQPASKFYRYRLVHIPGQPNAPSEFQRMPLKIVVRTEIDAVLPGTRDAYVNVHALNEYSPLRSAKPWRLQLAGQQGALLAQEAKNNHCKVGKWVCQAMMAGVENLKIGFITRASPDHNDKHTILNIQTFKVRDLGGQIGLREENVWAIVRAIIEIVMGYPDGKYILVKDPVKPEVKLYKTRDDEDEEGKEAPESQA